MTETDSVSAPNPRPTRLWIGAGIGLGAMLMAFLGTCAFRRGSADPEPEQFKRKVNAMAQDLIRDHWAAMRKAVEQIGTDEGAKAFFASNPGLSPRIPSETAFLETARTWRSILQPLPEVLPRLETHDLSYVKKTDQTEMSYRISNGTCIFMKWSQDRLVEMRIY